jgi:hypothetical protein
MPVKSTKTGLLEGAGAERRELFKKRGWISNTGYYRRFDSF